MRLHEGIRERITIEGGDPAQLAGRFAGEGARRLHLVDLDGAFSGRPSPGLLRGISSVTEHIPIQVGGGYRTVAAVAAKR